MHAGDGGTVGSERDRHRQVLGLVADVARRPGAGEVALAHVVRFAHETGVALAELGEVLGRPVDAVHALLELAGGPPQT